MVKSSSCCEKQVGLKKGPWTPEEDQKLKSYIQRHGGHGSWSSLPAKAGLQRCGKSCRLRWNNYLRPDIKRGNFNSQEDQTIIQLHALLGNKWSVIAHHLPERTDNEIKNYWNTHLKKRLTRLGINPTTHKPLNDAFTLSHMAQWETARLEAEARQANEYCKLQPSLTRLVLNNIASHPSPPPYLDVLNAWQNSWSSTSSNRNNDSNNTFGLINQSSLPSTTTTNTVVTKNEGIRAGHDEDDDNIMAAMEAFRYNKCNNMEVRSLPNDEDVLEYGFNEMSPQQNLNVSSSVGDNYWQAILNLANGSPFV